jgi:hypothetical protein
MAFLRRLFGINGQRTMTRPVFLMDPERPDAWLDIVGEAQYQRPLAALAGDMTRGGRTVADGLAILTPEPENPYDPDAIAVMIEGERVGYLSREDAIRYQAPVEAAASQGQLIACHPRYIGGRSLGDGLTGSIGVRLHIGSPRECMRVLDGDVDEGVIVGKEHPWVGYLIAFTGDSRYLLGDIPLDRETSKELACRAGMSVHPRVTKKVQLLVDCDPNGASINERKARQYGVPVISEAAFWAALDVDVELIEDETSGQDAEYDRQRAEYERERDARLAAEAAARATRQVERQRERTAVLEQRAAFESERRAAGVCLDCGGPIVRAPGRGRPAVRCAACRMGSAG